MSVKRIASTLALAVAASIGSPSVAQVGIPPTACSMQIDFPNVGGFRVLRGYNATNNPFGLPSGPYYPVNVTFGDIDHDGHDDFLFVGEQRFVLAVRVKNAAGDVLTTPEVIWVHFNQNGSLYKSNVPVGDSAAIADFDNDGFNEVAVVISDPAGPPNSNELVIFEDAPGLPGPLGDPEPLVGASILINSIASNWTHHSITGNGGNYNVDASSIYANPILPNEIMVTDTGGGRIGVLAYFSGALIPRYTRDYVGSSTHRIRATDVNGDGHDDILTNGVIDLWNGCSWDFRTAISFDTTVVHPTNNHADAIAVCDDGSASPPLYIVHDGYDLLVTNGGTTCTPSKIWENTQQNDGSTAIIHGQDIRVTELIDGPDAFGYDGPEIVTIPKGAPLYFEGSVALNGAGQELTVARNTNQPAPVGPRGGTFQVIDWDGGPTQEILSRSHARYSVWELVFDGTDPDLPYEWSEVVGVDVSTLTGPGTINSKFVQAYDFNPTTATDELVFLGTRGYFVRQCP